MGEISVVETAMKTKSGADAFSQVPIHGKP